jgi:membrane protease YdiL (CAAX protease family)
LGRCDGFNVFLRSRAGEACKSFAGLDVSSAHAARYSRKPRREVFVSNSEAVAGAPSESAVSTPVPDDRRPWGIWISFGWYLIVFEASWRVYDAILDVTGLAPVIAHDARLSALNNLTAWGINLLLILAAVRLTGVPVQDYLGWRRPPRRDVAIGILVIVALYAALGLLLQGMGAATPAVDEYRTAIAAGTSPWWFVLRWWPAIILASFVEESFFRGFLWHGIRVRLGTASAFAGTTLLFAAMHHGYWMRDGVVDPGSVVQYLVMSAIYGALRWRSGGTVVPIVAHGVSNAGLKIMVVALSAFVR